MTLTPAAYTFLGLTAIVACLVSVLAFALLRFSAAARDARQNRHRGGDTVMLSAALEEAVARLKAQERATAARAEASERLSSEIIASLTAGLLVVGMDAEIRILNPSGRPMLRRTVTLQQPRGATYLGVTVSPLTDVGGSLHGAICLFSDLTAVANLEE